MGGFGSGRWNNYTKKRIVEDCWTLDLGEVLVADPTAPPNCGILLSKMINGGGGSFLPVLYTFLEEENALYLDVTYPAGRRGSPEDVEERIKLLSTRPNYGGARWYFSCPVTTQGERCARRVSKLYLPPGERCFGCRKCHDLTYESSQTNHKYDSLYALWAGGEREGETFDLIKKAFSYRLKEARKRRAEGQGRWLEAFEDVFGEYL